MCQLLGIDPVVYANETNPDNNAIRDAAAQVILEERRQQAEAAKAKASTE